VDDFWAAKMSEGVRLSVRAVSF